MNEIFGNVTPPDVIRIFEGDAGAGGGIGNLLNLIFKLMIVGGSLFALFNFILAGYAFLAGGDDPKKIEAAWAKIYQSIIGLSFIAGAFVLAAIFGQIFFGNFNAIIDPEIPTINSLNSGSTNTNSQQIQQQQLPTDF